MPLHSAITASDFELVQYLVSQGADVNAKEEDGGVTVLHHAVFALDANVEIIEIIKFLVSKGANINAKDEDGRTPLDWAHHTEIARYLESVGGRSGNSDGR